MVFDETGSTRPTLQEAGFFLSISRAFVRPRLSESPRSMKGHKSHGLVALAILGLLAIGPALAFGQA